MTVPAVVGRRASDVVARADWPEAGDPAAPPVVPGFVVSSFAPLVAVVAGRCLGRATALVEVIPERTAIVIVTARGDVTSAAYVADAVDTGARIGPLMFFQSVPNAIAGHLATQYALEGPVVCLSPAGDTDPLAAGLAEAELLMSDGDAGAALVIVVEQDPDTAYAVLAVPDGGEK